MTCKEVVELVTDVLGGALSPEDRIRVEQHLLVCPPCTLHFGQVKATIELARGLGAASPPTEVEPRLLELFRRWRK